MFSFAEKTWNICEPDKNTYNQLLTDNMSKTEKTEHNICNKINKEGKTIAYKYGLSEIVDCLAKPNEFIALKDHKPNFSSKAKLGKSVNTFLNNLNVKSEIYHW